MHRSPFQFGLKAIFATMLGSAVILALVADTRHLLIVLAALACVIGFLGLTFPFWFLAWHLAVLLIRWLTRLRHKPPDV